MLLIHTHIVFHPIHIYYHYQLRTIIYRPNDPASINESAWTHFYIYIDFRSIKYHIDGYTLCNICMTIAS